MDRPDPTPQFDKTIDYAALWLKLYLENTQLLTELDESVRERNDYLKMVRILSSHEKQVLNGSSSQDSLINSSSADDMSEVIKTNILR